MGIVFGVSQRTKQSRLVTPSPVGRDLNLSRIWKMPIELGATGFFYRKYKRIDLDEEGKAINQIIEKPELPPVLPLFGFGFTWYSREKN